MRKISLIITILTIILCGLLFVLYFNRTVIPQKVKVALENSLGAQSPYSLSIDAVKFYIFKGFQISGVKITEKQNPEALLFSADKIFFKAIPLPSFRGIKIIIPSLSVDSPHIAVARGAQGDINVAGLLSELSKGSNTKSNINITVLRVLLKNGEATFADSYQDRQFKKTVTNLKANLKFLISGAVNFSVSGQIGNEGSSPSQFLFNGRYFTKSEDLVLKANIKDMPLTQYLNTYAPVKDFTVLAGLYDLKGTFSTKGLKNIKSQVELFAKNAEVSIKGISAKGEATLRGTLSFNVSAISEINYDMDCDITNTTVGANYDYLDKITITRAALNLKTKLWNIKSLDGIIYKGPLTISGTIESPLTSPKVNLKISSEFDSANVKKAKEFGINAGYIKATANLFSLPEGGLEIKGNTKLSSLNFKKDDLFLGGDYTVYSRFITDAAFTTISAYEGDIAIKNAKIGFLSNMPLIQNAEGKILFQSKSISIKDLTGIMADSKINISGKLDYTKELPLIDINISSKNVDLGEFIKALPEEAKANLPQLNMAGNADVNINILSNTANPGSLTYRGNLKIYKATATLPYLEGRIDELSCSLIFEKNNIAWENLSFIYKNKHYKSSGTASDLSKPLISAVLDSDILHAKGIIKIQDNNMSITKLDIVYENSSLQLEGSLTNLKDPAANISGNIRLDLEKIKNILPKYKDIAEKIKPKGQIAASFNLIGPLKILELWNMQAKFQSENIMLDKFSLGSLNASLILQDKFAQLSPFTLSPYNGTIDATARLNLNGEKKPYIINISAKNIDLNALIADTDINKDKIKKVKGILASDATLNGYLNDNNSLKGNGWVQVSQGYLGDFPVVDSLLNAILGIPVEYLTLTDAFGNFTIADKRIYTADFRILSQKAALLWEGSLGFDSSLDFGITGRFAEDISTKTNAFGKIASAVLSEAGSYIVEIKLTGTLAQPKYALVPFSVDKIIKEKLGDKLKDALGKIFE